MIKRIIEQICQCPHPWTKEPLDLCNSILCPLAKGLRLYRIRVLSEDEEETTKE